MSSRLARLCSFAFMPCLLCAAVAAATPTNYGDLLAARDGEVQFLGVTEDSPTDPTPLFGEPIQTGNKLLFFPGVFAASAANGGFDPTTGILTMSVEAPAGYSLGLITADEIGDCTLLGAGSPNTWCDVYGLLTVTDATPGTHGAFADLLDTTPMPPYMLPASTFTEFNSHAQIDLTGLGISSIALAFTNTLEANSEAGTTAFIQKKVLSLEVTTIPVPEPASGLLAACCLLPLLTRRRLTRRP